MIRTDSTPIPDWESFLRQHEKDSLTELELATLRLGDRVLVLTKQTAYMLVVRSSTEAVLTTNRADRPSGIITINGCTFGASSSIKPGHLFCGGNLEFRSTTHGPSIRPRKSAPFRLYREHLRNQPEPDTPVGRQSVSCPPEKKLRHTRMIPPIRPATTGPSDSAVICATMAVMLSLPDASFA